MSSPHYSSEDSTFGDLHVGNTHDDDGQVIDSMLIEVDDAPKPVVQHIVTPNLSTPKPPTRLLTGSLTVDPTWDKPTLLLPADVNRVGLVLRVTSPTAVATDFVRIADDAGKLQGQNSSAGPLFHGQTIDLGSGDGGHTGAIWVSSLSASAVVIISYWSTVK